MIRMASCFGLRESVVCLQRLLNVAMSLERDHEYSIEEISARISVDESLVRRGMDVLEYSGMFKRNVKNNKYFVDGNLK